MKNISIGVMPLTKEEKNNIKNDKEYRTSVIDRIGRIVFLEIMNSEEMQKKIPYYWEENKYNYSQEIFGRYIELKYLLDMMTISNNKYYYADVEYCYTDKFNGENILNFSRTDFGYCKDKEWGLNSNALFELKIYPYLNKVFLIKKSILKDLIYDKNGEPDLRYLNCIKIPVKKMVEFKLSDYVDLDITSKFGTYKRYSYNISYKKK